MNKAKILRLVLLMLCFAMLCVCALACTPADDQQEPQEGEPEPLPMEDAVLYGVLIHGGAGDLCARELGEYSMTPSDMIEALPKVMKELTER